MASPAFRAAAIVVLGVAVVSGVAADEERFAQFDGEVLQRGRAVWLGTCKNCHATGFADAPAVTAYANWAPRLQQPIETLYAHALNGFYGADYAHMPPRGGNDALSDDEVMRAVDYMVALVKHLNQEEKP